MMKVRNAASFAYVIVAGLLLSFSAFAGDAFNVNVSGKVIAAPCEVRGDSLDQQVNLGDDLKTTYLQRPGDATDWVPFDIGLVSCPAGTTQVTATFNGDPDEDNPADMYKNDGDAKNVAIQVQSTGGNNMGDGSSYTGLIVGNSYTYHLKARVYTQKGQGSSGTVSAAMTATFTFQ